MTTNVTGRFSPETAKDGFIVLAIPRSRTTWLSRYLSYGEWFCGHDEAIRMRGFDDVNSWFALGKTGSVESSIAPFWRLIAKLPKNIRIVTVRRPVGDSVDSVIRAGAPETARAELTRVLTQHDRKLDQLEARIPGVMRVEYADLALEKTCARVFEYCTGLPHDHDWWASLADKNIQINFPWLVRYMRDNSPQIEKFSETAKHVIIRDISMRHTKERDDVVVAEEGFESFFRDSRDMFERHCVCVGESPRQFNMKNIALARRLDQAGRLQIVTARSNGRVFGYLATVIGPSLEQEGRLSATHTIFYAGEEFPGVGLKMQREAISLLKKRGVSEVFFHDGVRGAGGRNRIIYRRLGAEEFGSVHRLDLE